MNSPHNRRFVRLDVQLVLEIDDPDALRRTARDRVAGDGTLPNGERGRIETVVTHDTAEALAYLVDPFDLVSALPGIELTQTSWSAEHIGRGPDSPRADHSGDDAGYDDEDDGYDEDFAENFDDDLDLDDDFGDRFGGTGDGAGEDAEGDVGGQPARIGIG
jgi:hypothetical protein